jgi:hypothetical protein
MKVAIAVTRIKRLDRYCNQEITLSGVTNSFAFRCTANSIGLVQRMRHVIGEGALPQNPLRVGLRKCRQSQQETNANVSHKVMPLRI